MRKALEGWGGGLSVGGLKISNLRYADDTTLVAKTGAEMVDLLNRLDTVSREMGLYINQAKTKIMIVDRSRELQDVHLLSQYDIVEDFVYLGSSISNKGGTEGEIRRRIGMAKSAMTQLEKVWKDRNVLNKTKIYIVRTLVFPIFLYGAESWTIKMADRRRIDAFEMWCWRRLLRIPWTAHRTNISILKELKITQRLSSICLKKVLTYFGHIVRKPSDNLEKLMITGKMEGKRLRGRSPIRWSDLVTKSLNTTITDALNHAKDRDRWKQLCGGISDGREHHDAQH
ncbi:hypothetical protein ABMA28_016906 [Loxostege sticticalis]|uniref:Reverse transcriptase domain-containing protein n=1 Tax=Loxostege sticticalis TaxID=481309 RepID=A0ABD0T6D3_LOXSC